MTRIAIRATALATVGILAGAVYLAYGYTPPEESGRSGYLQEIGAQNVETKSYQFNSVRSGAGTPVVLIHGAGTWLYSFRRNIPALAMGHTVYAFDMPGHGYTKAKQQPDRYDLALMSEAMLEYLDSQKLQKVSLVGHSFGGGWALYFAQQHPERVEKLVLLAPRALDVPYILEWQLMKYPIVGELFSKLFTRNDVRRGLENAHFNKATVTDAVTESVYIPLTFSENRRAQYHLVRDSDWRLTMSGMGGVRVPTLILWGKEDQYLAVGQLAQYKASMPKVRTQILDGCGHSLQEECAERVNELLIRYLSETQ
jgi:pimeloyl-ACP methyl ester carboxylesterase